jgi:hypothetical protein
VKRACFVRLGSRARQFTQFSKGDSVNRSVDSAE